MQCVSKRTFPSFAWPSTHLFRQCSSLGQGPGLGGLITAHLLSMAARLRTQEVVLVFIKFFGVRVPSDSVDSCGVEGFGNFSCFKQFNMC